MADMAVFADDTVHILVEPLSDPAAIRGYIWSFDGGKTYSDTTNTNTLIRSWNAEDSGYQNLSVQAYDSRNVFSDLVEFKVFVMVCRPTISIIAASPVDFHSMSVLSISRSSGCPHIEYVLWSFDGGITFIDTTPNGVLLKQWSISDTGRDVAVAAIAQVARGLFSEPALCTIHVGCCRPTITITGDSVSSFSDGTLLRIVNTAPCSVACYLWAFDQSVSFTDTTYNPSYFKQWQRQDSGMRTVIAAARTGAGIVSVPDTFLIRIFAEASLISLPDDTTVTANDTVTLRARSSSVHSELSRFFWSIDHSVQAIATDSGALRYSWTPDQAGTHCVMVSAVDAYGAYSAADSMLITVVAVFPSLTVPLDTLVGRNDTVTASVIAEQPRGTILRYLWNVNSISWTDSGTSAVRKIWYQGSDTVRVIAGARDDHGNLGIDSFHIFFNAPPINLRMIAPAADDTLIFRWIDSTFSRRKVIFHFSAFDRNGPSDTLTYRLYLNKSPGSAPDTLMYTGRDTAVTVARLDTATNRWKLIAKDRFGDSMEAVGSFTCILQQTVCFAGHSIVAGFGSAPSGGCEDSSGGFRKKVLTTLRERRNGEAKVKSIGPLTTICGMEDKEDSCFAVGSFRAKDLWLLMRNSFPNLNADIWVLMLGVNDRYSFNELFYIVQIVDLIHANNRLACTYVINGLPYNGPGIPGVTGQKDTVFNRALSDSIKVRKQNRNIWNIDAYKVFAVNNTPNPLLFTPTDPLLHPNRLGYDTLARMLLDTMLLDTIKFRAP